MNAIFFNRRFSQIFFRLTRERFILLLRLCGSGEYVRAALRPVPGSCQFWMGYRGRFRLRRLDLRSLKRSGSKNTVKRCGLCATGAPAAVEEALPRGEEDFVGKETDDDDDDHDADDLIHGA